MALQVFREWCQFGGQRESGKEEVVDQKIVRGCRSCTRKCLTVRRSVSISRRSQKGFPNNSWTSLYLSYKVKVAKRMAI